MSQRNLFRCKCSKIQFSITGDPFLQLNCHCHYCVGSIRFLQEKSLGQPSETLDPIKVDFFNPDQLDFSNSDITVDLIAAIRVNEKNPPVRKYTTCCNTFVAIVPPLAKYICVNRTRIYKQDGSKYVPSNDIMNAQKKNAFEPESVPEPSVETFWFGIIPTLLMKMMNPFGSRLTEPKALIDVSSTKIERIPITWEGE